MPLKSESLEASYIVEHQESLNTMVLSVSLPSPSPSAVSLSVETPREAILKWSAPITPAIRIPLPTPAPLTTYISTSIVDGHVEARIPAVPVTMMPTLAISHPLDAAELRELKASRLLCAQCSLPFVALPLVDGEFGGYKDLPGEYWAELSEVWMCHSDPDFTRRLTERTKEGFWPKADEALVGGSYLLLSSGAVQPDAVTVTSHPDVSPLLARHPRPLRTKRRPSLLPMSGCPSWRVEARAEL